MIDLSDCILLGTITKLHGFRGDLIIRLNNINAYKIETMELVFIEIDGLPVPFFISEFVEKDTNSLIVKFEDINNEESAKELIDTKVFLKSLPGEIDLNKDADTAKLIGFEVIDANYGSLGEIYKIIDIHQNPLLQILKEKQEILIPFRPEFILKFDHENLKLFVNIPEGLLDIN